MESLVREVTPRPKLCQDLTSTFPRRIFGLYNYAQYTLFFLRNFELVCESVEAAISSPANLKD